MATEVTKGVRVTGADRAKLTKDFVRRYKAGESIRAMQVDSGRSYGSIHALLVESGVTMRSRGGPTRGAGSTAAKKKPAPKQVAAKTLAPKKVAAKQVAAKTVAAKTAPKKAATTTKATVKRAAKKSAGR